MYDEKTRLQYWDMAKGLTIILVIIGHADNIDPLVRRIIFSFDMPFFFIANGFFIKDYNIKRTLQKSIKSLIKPYVIVCLISTCIYMIINWSESFAINLSNLFRKIIALFCGVSYSSTILCNVDSVWLVWFVICLFAARNIYVILMSCIKNLKIIFQVLIIILIAVFGMYVGEEIAFLPWSLDVALVSLLFLFVGNLLAKNQLFEKNYFLLMIFSFIVWMIPLFFKLNIELAIRAYPWGLVSIVEAIGGSICVSGFFYLLSKNGIVLRPLTWLGRNSMVILAVHCIEMMYFDWNKYVFDLFPEGCYKDWIIVALVKVIGIISISWGFVFLKVKLKSLINFAKLK